jgi:hypothetical protein
MKSFFSATVKTSLATYYIDLKSGEDYHQLRNKYAVITNGVAVYLNTLQDCIEWIEFYDGALQKRAIQETA